MTEYRVFVLLVFVAVLLAVLCAGDVVAAALLRYLDRKWKESSQ